jgi:hypothetical protein
VQHARTVTEESDGVEVILGVMDLSDRVVRVVTLWPAAQMPVSLAPSETNPWMMMLSASARIPGIVVSPVPE